jgi:hypothetical protein
MKEQTGHERDARSGMAGVETRPETINVTSLKRNSSAPTLG